MADDKVLYDVDGYDIITEALMDLINQYPALQGDSFTFATLNENSGKAMFPQGGAVIQQQRIDVLGRVRQICQYPFYIVYRAGGLSSNRKLNVKEWLDNLGRWLEGQPITVNEETHRLEKYPELSEGRRFTQIQRSSVASLNSINDNNTEDWAIAITAQYTNDFTRL